MSKFIFVTGGVVSSLGKGLASASIGNLLESRGLKITFLKLDPYINVDPGTMNPYQHGEVFVTDDGAETDLDLGHYERFTSLTLTKENNYTTGRIYHSVITKERRGDYLGGTVQVVPHITDEIKRCITNVAKDTDVAIVEIGGTVGDIESLPFLEAIRQMPYDVGRENVLYIHLTLVPYIGASGELKTKPTQHSVNKLREIGIQPNILLCRTDRYLPPDLKDKIALFCNVEKGAVITAKDVETVYEVPIVFRKEGLDELIVRQLKLETGPPNLREWDAMVQKIKRPKHEISVALVGKYIGLKESYKSLAEALVHGGVDHETRVNIHWIESEEVERRGAEQVLRDADGILIPGGFGVRHRRQDPDNPLREGGRHPVPGSLSRHAVRRDRAGQERGGPRGGQQLGVRSPLAASGHPSHGTSEIRPREGRDHEARRLSLPPAGRQPRPQGLRRLGSQGAAPAPIRIQQRLSRPAGGARACPERPVARRRAGRNRGAEGPPLVSGHAVPPGVLFAAAPAPSALQRLRRRGPAAEMRAVGEAPCRMRCRSAPSRSARRAAIS